MYRPSLDHIVRSTTKGEIATKYNVTRLLLQHESIQHIIPKMEAQNKINVNLNLNYDVFKAVH